MPAMTRVNEAKPCCLDTSPGVQKNKIRSRTVFFGKGYLLSNTESIPIFKVFHQTT